MTAAKRNTKKEAGEEKAKAKTYREGRNESGSKLSVAIYES